MYTVTFYSYKGGVGRTMALANVAYMLASAGKRVLVVDFDLEAPGLSTYEGLNAATLKRGVVEYICQYTGTRSAPDVGEFISECQIGKHNIWLMAAGDHHAAGYAGLLNSIDWGSLYNDHQGFLFMEDLKQQWAQYNNTGFDYVLIDSRTGHTDVGGICTRQLPDAVAIMFVPTSQNIDGLKPIVTAIRAEGPPVRDNKIELHFCPSNVPDLDDQESILSSLLDGAKDALGYRDTSAVIQHYASLELLKQPIYAYSNEKTKLVRQYRELYTTIISKNISDEDGALIAAERLIEKYADALKADDRNELLSINRTISRIKSYHGRTPKVALALAVLANKMGEPAEEVQALTAIVEQGLATPRVFLHRAIALASLNSDEDAASDLKMIFYAENVSMFDLAPAGNLLKRILPDEWLKIYRDALKKRRADASGLAYLAHQVLTDREGAALAAYGTTGAERRNALSGTIDAIVSVARALALIGSGQFQAAKDFLFEDRLSAISSDSIYDVFNYGVADWCIRSLPDEAIFNRVIELRPSLKTEPDANLHQCMGLAYMAVQNWQAASASLASAASAEKSALTFSCWSYLSLNEVGFDRDVADMQLKVQHRRIGPLPFA
jgi:cellulose biosynthesis protein BcsQ